MRDLYVAAANTGVHCVLSQLGGPREPLDQRKAAALEAVANAPNTGTSVAAQFSLYVMGTDGHMDEIYGNALTLPIASLSVSMACGLAALSKPIWLSEICRKVKPWAWGPAAPTASRFATVAAAVLGRNSDVGKVRLRRCRDLRIRAAFPAARAMALASPVHLRRGRLISPCTPAAGRGILARPAEKDALCQSSGRSSGHCWAPCSTRRIRTVSPVTW